MYLEMRFESFSDFLQMGKHGYYVWMAYGLSFLLLAGLIAHIVLNRFNTVKKLRRLQRHSNHLNADSQTNEVCSQSDN